SVPQGNTKRFRHSLGIEFHDRLLNKKHPACRLKHTQRFHRNCPSLHSTNYMEYPPADLSQDDRNVIFESLDLNFNREILESLLQAITLWNTRFRRDSILLTTITFGVDWVYQRRAFIQNGDNFYSVFVALQAIGPWWRMYQLVDGISGGITTLIVDITIIWCCWMFWGRLWCIIVIPAICTLAGIVTKSMQIRSVFINITSEIDETGGFAAEINWSLFYLSLTLTTTLLRFFVWRQGMKDEVLFSFLISFNLGSSCDASTISSTGVVSQQLFFMQDGTIAVPGSIENISMRSGHLLELPTIIQTESQ
ncbi:uncharacterized protein EV420DRAFT_1670229, partial [Desarmillaria tabescens]